MFAIAYLAKKLGFHKEICDYFEKIAFIEF